MREFISQDDFKELLNRQMKIIQFFEQRERDRLLSERETLNDLIFRERWENERRSS